jgi:CHAT domain-containing protein
VGSAAEIPVLVRTLHRIGPGALRRQAAHTIASLLTPPEESYSLFSPVAEARRSAADRILRSLPSGDRRRAGAQFPITRAVTALDDHNYADLALACRAVVTRHNPAPAAALLLNITENTADRISEEEALLCLFAASLLVRSGAGKLRWKQTLAG